MSDYERIVTEEIEGFLELPQWLIYLSILIGFFTIVVFYPLAKIYFWFEERIKNAHPRYYRIT